MYSNLECDGDVEMNGKRSALIGGKSFIAGKLAVKTLGTPAHTATQVHMATSGMRAKQEAEELTQKIQALDADIAKLVQLLNRLTDLEQQNRITDDMRATMEQVKQQYVKQNAERKKAADSHASLKAKMLEQSQANSYIECKDRVHTGVRITFGPLTYVVQESFVNSRIGIIDKDIGISPL